MNTNMTEFLKEKHIPVPDNNTPDSEVAIKIKTILKDQLELEYDQIMPEMDLLRDLGMDALDCMEVLMSIEQTFGKAIPVLEDVLSNPVKQLPKNDKEELTEWIGELAEKLDKLRTMVRDAMDMQVTGILRVLKEGDKFDEADKVELLLEKMEADVKAIEDARGQVARVALKLSAEGDDMTEEKIEELEAQLGSVEEKVEEMDVFGITRMMNSNVSLVTVGEIIALVEWQEKENNR